MSSSKIMNAKKVLVYILYAFLPMIGIGLVINPAHQILHLALSAGAMLLPLLAVIITQLVFKEPVLKGLDISFNFNRWWVIGWLLMPVLAMAVLGMTLLMPGARWVPDNEMIQMVLQSMPEGFGIWGLIGITLVSGLFSGISINAIFAFGEEIGWRGYLLKVLKGRKFLLVALLIGVIWGFWHAPLILNGHNYPQHPVAGVFMMVLFCLLLTPMLMYFRIKGGSVIVPAIMHGTFNAVVGITNLVVTPYNDLLYGGPGLAGMIVLLLVNVGLFLYDRFVSKENVFSSEI